MFLPSLLASGRDKQFSRHHDRGDEFHHGSLTPVPRGLSKVRRTVYPPGYNDQVKVKTDEGATPG